MDLHSGRIYWQQTVEKTPAYPSLTENIECDVLIVGCGSSGAQTVHFLQKSGLSIVMVDKRKVGHGSTSANTSLIQYLAEKTVSELVQIYGEENTFRHFDLCQKAINDIEAAGKTLPIDPQFKRRNSLYFASSKADVKKLYQDFIYLTKHGYRVDWLTEEEIGKRYPFKKCAAIYTYKDGEMNPLKYVYGLLEAANQNGVRIYEKTEVIEKKAEHEGITVFTATGCTIRTKKLVYAGGYENLEFYKDKNAILTSTYAVVTSPVDNFQEWYERSLIWETARPYLYFRTTPDERVIIGGLDETVTAAGKRDHKILHKRDKLLEEFHRLFPSMNVKAEYYLGANYGLTHDGLPMIGIYDNFPNCYYIYGYGDNGTIYNMILARIIADLIKTGKSENLDLYLHHE